VPMEERYTKAAPWLVIALLQRLRNGRLWLRLFFIMLIIRVAIKGYIGSFNRVIGVFHLLLLFCLPREALAELSLFYAAGPYAAKARTAWRSTRWGATCGRGTRIRGAPLQVALLHERHRLTLIAARMVWHFVVLLITRVVIVNFTSLVNHVNGFYPLLLLFCLPREASTERFLFCAAGPYAARAWTSWRTTWPRAASERRVPMLGASLEVPRMHERHRLTLVAVSLRRSPETRR
jgi:hypothetical protein